MCVTDRGSIPHALISWPYFTFSPDGTSIYVADDDTITEYTYPGFVAVGTYASSPLGYFIFSMGTKADGTIWWVESDFESPIANWILREGAAATSRATGSGDDLWAMCVSPYDDEVYVCVAQLAGDLALYRYGSGTLNLVSATPAQDFDAFIDMGLVGTLDGGIWVPGGNGNVGRFDIPTDAQHYSPDNDDPGGGAYPDSIFTVSLLPRPNGEVWVAAGDGTPTPTGGKTLTWTGSAITITDQDCLDAYTGGSVGFTPNLSRVAFGDWGSAVAEHPTDPDLYIYELVRVGRWALGKTI